MRCRPLDARRRTEQEVHPTLRHASGRGLRCPAHRVGAVSLVAQALGEKSDSGYRTAAWHRRPYDSRA